MDGNELGYDEVMNIDRLRKPKNVENKNCMQSVEQS